MNSSSSYVVLDKNLSMQEVVHVIENHDLDIFLIYDENKPSKFLGVLTTSDFIHFLYRDLWCGESKRREKLVDLVKEYGNKILPMNVEILTNTQHNISRNKLTNLDCMEQQTGEAKVKNFLENQGIESDSLSGHPRSMRQSDDRDSMHNSKRNSKHNSKHNEKDALVPKNDKLDPTQVNITLNNSEGNTQQNRLKPNMVEQPNSSFQELRSDKEDPQPNVPTTIINSAQPNQFSPVKSSPHISTGETAQYSHSQVPKNFNSKLNHSSQEVSDNIMDNNLDISFKKHNTESNVNHTNAKKDEKSLANTNQHSRSQVTSSFNTQGKITNENSLNNPSSEMDKKGNTSDIQITGRNNTSMMNRDDESERDNIEFKMLDQKYFMNNVTNSRVYSRVDASNNYEVNSDLFDKMSDKPSAMDEQKSQDEYHRDDMRDKEYMLHILDELKVVQYLNLAYYRRKYNYKKKDKVFAKLEREEIEKAVHNHFEDRGEDEFALKVCIEQRRDKHTFPKKILTVDLEDSLFKACELMFFSYVRHLVVTGDPENSDKPKNDIQGVLNSSMIMRYIFKHFKIEQSMHQWLNSDKSEESLFKKPLIQLNIGLYGDDLIKGIFIADTIYKAIKVMNKNLITTIPVFYSEEDQRLVAFIEREDVIKILYKREFLLNPMATISDFLTCLITEHHHNKATDMQEANEDFEEERDIDLSKLHLRDKVKILDEKDSLYTVMEHFGNGMQRGIYLNSDGKLYGIVGISDIFHFFVYKEIYYSVNDEIQTMKHKNEDFKMMGLDNVDD